MSVKIPKSIGHVPFPAAVVITNVIVIGDLYFTDNWTNMEEEALIPSLPLLH